MAKEEINNQEGGDDSAIMALLTAQKAALETAIVDKDKTIAELKAKIVQLESGAKTSVSTEETKPEWVIPTEVVEIKGEKYRAKRAALWHGLRKITMVEAVKDADLIAELVATYPTEFVQVD